VSELDDEKRFYERFWTLLRDRDMMMIFERFGPEAFRRSSVLEGFEAFIQEAGFRGDTVVEIGSFRGLTALVLARYFRRVVSIDIINDPMRHEIYKAIGMNVEFIVVPDNDRKAKAIELVDFDAAFIDGDHEHDTDTDFALVKRCGRVLFHEVWDAQPAVKRLVESLPPSVIRRDKWAAWIRS
jgi:SAM-dependent methyltransferase